ncbi:hypothetical protein O3802_05220 [Gemella sp. 27098_8_92]|uniref:hypothetical protein n=1 Tax=Gemella sp. 27098_8_92 TaxID=3003687 RepID=UPI00352C499C
MIKEIFDILNSKSNTLFSKITLLIFILSIAISLNIININIELNNYLIFKYINNYTTEITQLYILTIKILGILVIIQSIKFFIYVKITHRWDKKENRLPHTTYDLINDITNILTKTTIIFTFTNITNSTNFPIENIKNSFTFNNIEGIFFIIGTFILTCNIFIYLLGIFLPGKNKPFF